MSSDSAMQPSSSFQMVRARVRIGAIFLPTMAVGVSTSALPMKITWLGLGLGSGLGRGRRPSRRARRAHARRTGSGRTRRAPGGRPSPAPRPAPPPCAARQPACTRSRPSTGSEAQTHGASFLGERAQDLRLYPRERKIADVFTPHRPRSGPRSLDSLDVLRSKGRYQRHRAPVTLGPAQACQPRNSDPNRAATDA
eukprot:scaffold20830_cov44-Phaeocystis_antarctica.AAC.1